MRLNAHLLLPAWIIAGCVALCHASDAQTAAPPRARAAQGELIGRLHDGVAAYLGIPYAAPPTGALRFRPPAEPAAWSTPREAAEYGSACPQSARLGSPSTNEDCLFLNVWAPAGAGPHPVLVFIHGGSFNAGNGGVTHDNPNGPGPSYDGSDLARQAGAVVVTINYRLGLLGFLTSPALDAESPAHASGNYGLLDQQAALRWVARNIAAFGGDPGQVTVFGESAGGISVLLQLASPSAAGLFQRAIVESADDGAAPKLAQAEAKHAAVIEALGCTKPQPAEAAACLRALPVAPLLTRPGFAPVIDGATLPEPAAEAFAAGRFNRVPVIDGTNQYEGSYFLTVAEQSAGRALTAADRMAIEAKVLGEAVGAVDAAYPPGAYVSPGAALAAIVTDSFFACPSLRARQALAKHVPVFGYEFRQPEPTRNFPLPTSPVSPPDIPLGDSHTTELAYVFGHDGTGAPLLGPNQHLSVLMIGLWARQQADGSGFAIFAEPPVAPPFNMDEAFALAHHCDVWQRTGARALIVSVPKP